jgi:hypothetical protein
MKVCKGTFDSVEELNQYIEGLTKLKWRVNLISIIPLKKQKILVYYTREERISF